jgi:putative adenine specific DNA methyltransferase
VRKSGSAVYLKDNADFALGIVTGNNKDYISDIKTSENEMILKGADISKYHINPTTNYITFKPESFQQIAPTEMYRAPEKLLYRFISNQLVFAYDDKQTLSLNSCNIVIPKLDGIKLKYILAILNSRVAQFIYKREFNSVKVLRSHIECIPIPAVDEQTQDKIISLTNQLIDGLDGELLFTKYDELDTIICELYKLTNEEQKIIKQAVDTDNKFLE